MDKKKIGFFIIGIAMILMIVGLLLNLSKKEEQPITETKGSSLTQKEKEEFEKETDSHAQYVQDVDKDPFNNVTEEVGEVKSGTLPFNYEFIKGATYDHTGATLIDSSSKYLLFRNLNDVLSFYNIENRKKNVLDELINQAVIAQDNKYILYSKNSLFTESFFAFDTSSNETMSLGEYSHTSRMQAIDMKYANGLLYYLVRETDTGKTFVKFVGIPGANTLTSADKNAKIDIKTDKLFQTKDTVYAYNSATKDVEVIFPNNSGKTLINLKNQNIKEIKNIQYIDETHWVVSFINNKNEFVLYTPKGENKEFKGLMEAYWIDEQHLVVNDNLTFYTYNPETNEKHVLKSDVSDFVYQFGFMTLQTRNSDLIVIQKK